MYGLAANTIGSLVVKYGGPDLPWWVWAFTLMGFVAVVGHRNIDVGAKVLGVLLILEVVAIVALSVSVFAKGGAHGCRSAVFSSTHVDLYRDERYICAGRAVHNQFL